MPDEPPIVFDLGTGIRRFGETQAVDRSFRATALVTHIHWDHVQGLPFFSPIHSARTFLDIYCPIQDNKSLESVFGELIRPPFFPIHCRQLQGDIAFHGVCEDDFALGDAKVRVRPVPHCGPTVGYRVEWAGATVAYVSDHQAPLRLDTVADSVLDLCEGADLLIHDAQYTPEEFARKSDWGHCTVAYSVLVAKQAGVRTLALFHHDPSHDDKTLDGLLDGAREVSAAIGGPPIIAASEGMVIVL